jgi:hypothetical protein
MFKVNFGEVAPKVANLQKTVKFPRQFAELTNILLNLKILHKKKQFI